MSKVISLFLFFVVFNVWSNTIELETFFYLTKYQDFEEAKKVAAKFEDEELKIGLINLADILSDRTSINFVSLDANDANELRFVKLLILGYQNAYASKRNSLKAYNNFSDALKLSEIIGKPNLIKASLIALLDLFGSEIFIGSKQYESYLERFIELKSDKTDEALIILYNLVFFTKADDDINDIDAQYYNYIEKLDSIFAKFPKSHNLFTRYYYEKGMYYKIEEDNEKAEDFFLKADSLAAQNSDLQYLRVVNAWQLAAINYQKNDLEKAKRYLKVSQKLARKLRDSFYISRLNSLIFKKEGVNDSAYHYLRKSIDIEYQLGYKNNTLESSILTVQNQTDKLKLDKLELDAQSRKNRNWATFLVVLLILGTAIAFLVYSNTKRKQLLAEQQKRLQEQKVTTLLKEQELSTIDAMIEGQEKERQRIANDLHDDLGGLMATVKLHFNSLHSKVKDDKDDMYEKTNNLLDEAYHKIRTIAHAKNSGVIAKQGLLKAIEQMAEKVSVANAISIQVKDFGLDNRLENSLQLTLFRIIQELITNTIKHAKATKVNIHLTNHGDSLNILIEDNGIGFESNIVIAASNGMGLKSIDKRITHLDGTLHIESEPGKGSTIIIDIPI
ncbi:histidine kinase [Maribacter spongiicola]|uniref:Oxygen sensor histidine kinase NreB n=1 Tax=Maribacter spongiicola TaxID=1206753 RepID=A0A4R7K7D5_9FLAO|nr:ATP-binding protein [Maribacter spongiicola]TDT46502.1 histidine kinase [Maribacter spongiicola]